jgi:hypothetical protein
MFNKKKHLLFFFITAIPTRFCPIKTHSFEEVEQLSTENPNSLSCLFILLVQILQNDGKLYFKKPAVIKELNENFYFTFDAETKKKSLSQSYRPNVGNQYGNTRVGDSISNHVDECLSHIDCFRHRLHDSTSENTPT